MYVSLCVCGPCECAYVCMCTCVWVCMCTCVCTCVCSVQSLALYGTGRGQEIVTGRVGGKAGGLGWLLGAIPVPCYLAPHTCPPFSIQKKTQSYTVAAVSPGRATHPSLPLTALQEHRHRQGVSGPARDTCFTGTRKMPTRRNANWKTTSYVQRVFLPVAAVTNPTRLVTSNSP